MPMSYGGASVAAPATSGPNDAGYFKSLFDYIFATYNADTATFVAADPTTHNASVGSVTAVALSNSQIPFLARAFDATARALWTGQTNLGVTTSSIFSDGSATLASLTLNGAPLTVPSGGSGRSSVAAGRLLLGAGAGAMTELAGVSDGQLVVWSAGAAAWQPGGVSQASLADSLATPGTAGQINVAAQKPYVDSNGQVVGPLAAAAVALPTQPTGTHFQYVGISRAPTTGSLVVTTGTLDAAESLLVIPQGNDPIASVNQKGATTNPTNVIAAADIKDIRGPRYGLGSASSGFAGTVAALTSGNYTATYPNTLDVTNAGAALAIQPPLVRQSTSAAALADMLKFSVPPALLTALSDASAGRVQLAGTANNPIPLEIGGQWCVLATTATSNAASGSIARWFLFADRTAATLAAQSLPAGAFTVTLAATNTPTATQRLIGTVQWDGGAHVQIGATSNALGVVDGSPLVVLNTGHLRPSPANTVAVNGTPITVTTTTTFVTTVGTAFNLYTPQTLWYDFDVMVEFKNPSLVGLQMGFLLADTLNSGAPSQAANTDELLITATSTSQNERRMLSGLAQIVAGNHALQVYARCLQSSQSFQVGVVRMGGLLYLQ